MATHQAPHSLGFSRQEHWSGLPFPSPMHKSESEVAQSCPTLSDPMDCSPPGSSVHGIFQARVLKWGAIAFSEPRHKWPQIHPPVADLTVWTHTAQRLIPQRTLLHSFPRSINAQEIVSHQWETAGPRLWLVGEKCAWKRFNSLFSFCTLFLCSLSWPNSASEFLKEKSLHYIEMTWSHVII